MEFLGRLPANPRRQLKAGIAKGPGATVIDAAVMVELGLELPRWMELPATAEACGPDPVALFACQGQIAVAQIVEADSAKPTDVACC